MRGALAWINKIVRMKVGDVVQLKRADPSARYTVIAIPPPALQKTSNMYLFIYAIIYDKFDGLVSIWMGR